MKYLLRFLDLLEQVFQKQKRFERLEKHRLQTLFKQVTMGKRTIVSCTEKELETLRNFPEIHKRVLRRFEQMIYFCLYSEGKYADDLLSELFSNKDLLCAMDFYWQLLPKIRDHLVEREDFGRLKKIADLLLEGSLHTLNISMLLITKRVHSTNSALERRLPASTITARELMRIMSAARGSSQNPPL